MNAGEPCHVPFRVLATYDYFEPGFRGGGPVRSLAQVLDTACPQVRVRLITGDRDLGASHPYPGLSGRWADRGRAGVFYLDVRRAGQWLRLWRAVRRSSFDLLYVNSVWSPLFTVIPIVALRLGLIRAETVLVAPRGSFSVAALSLKARKKRLFLGFWRPFLKSMNVQWHATDEREAADILAICPWAVIKISSDQVALPAEPLTPTSHDQAARLVYIGRITASKNLDLVLRALLAVTPRVVFDIYGPVQDRHYWSTCQALVKLLPDEVRVRYLGEISHAEVRTTFGWYDAFVFPTSSENFGHVIAESLSSSCPVICSAETPWTSVLESGGGVVIKALTSECLGAEIDRIAAMTPAERMDARRRSGQAYRSWRRDADGPNILDVARSALMSDSHSGL